jgi:formate hydrogenlyase subunit 3/multisubunit Na+/H+ antiporter MnhD subunit
LFHKELVVPEAASFIHYSAPVVAFTAMLIVPLLIPVLTNYPLPFVANDHRSLVLSGYLVVDPLGSWVVLCAAMVYASASVYAVGYMRLLGESQRLPYFYALFAGFALATLVYSDRGIIKRMVIPFAGAVAA